MNYTNCTIIILAADQAAAQALSSDEYFNAAASETGEAPATHYFMSGPFSNTEVDALINDGFGKWIRSEDWQAALESLNLKQIITQEPI